MFWQEYDKPVAVSHRAVTKLLRHPSFGRQMPEDLRPPVPDHLQDFYGIEEHSMLEIDGARHSKLRRMGINAFRRDRVAAMAPEISMIASDLIAAFPEGPFDFLSAFANVLPVRVIARFIGVPEDMATQFLVWSHAMVGMYQAGRSAAMERSANDAALAFRTYLEDFISYRRANPDDDLLSQLIEAEAKEATISQDELISTIILLLNAGHEATVHTLGNGLHTLLRLNQPYEAMNPTNVTAAIEEIIRFDPPLHLFDRIAQEDTELFDLKVKRGDRVAACLAAANRDARVWAAPDRFDPTRTGSIPASFGGGAHFCIGAPLARLELQIAFPAVYRPTSELRLVEPARYADIYHFHGLERLMVERVL
ncbi:MAG: cytochrome P450 [Pseudomonadota bacterium]